VVQLAVAALSERRNCLKIQDRRSETAATKIELTLHPRNAEVVSSLRPLRAWRLCVNLFSSVDYFTL
jgi:hypothetical protein